MVKKLEDLPWKNKEKTDVLFRKVANKFPPKETESKPVIKLVEVYELESQLS